jgi:UDP-2,4-diacetamido-2,4,6-trideoxy-beta-L-altropyranose hydrolase
LNIVIFTEAGTNIGFGHVIRCYALYQAFQLKGFQPEFIIKSDVPLKSIIYADEIKYLDWHNSTIEIKQLIKAFDIVVFDSYLVSPEILVEFANLVKTPVFIDDYLRMNYPFGIVFNGAVGAEKLPYTANPGIKYLLGPDFQPIRSEFWDCPKKKLKPTINNVFLSVGGNDIHGILPKLIHSIKNQIPESRIELVCGNIKTINDLSALYSNQNVHFHLNISALKMKVVMEKCDLALSAAGQTLYELAATGTPTVSFSVADNQNNNLEGWTKAGFVVNAGSISDVNFYANIEESIQYLFNIKNRNISSQNGQKLLMEEADIIL